MGRNPGWLGPVVEPPAIGILLDPPLSGLVSTPNSDEQPAGPACSLSGQRDPPVSFVGGRGAGPPPPPGSMGGNRAFLQAKEPLPRRRDSEGREKGRCGRAPSQLLGWSPGRKVSRKEVGSPPTSVSPRGGEGVFFAPHRSPLNDRILKRGQDGGAVSQEPSWPPSPPRGSLRKAPGVGTLWGWVGREQPGTAWQPSPTPPPVPRHPCRRGSEG